MTFQLSENATPNWVIISYQTEQADSPFVVCSSYDIGQERLVVAPDKLVATVSEILTRRYNLPDKKDAIREFRDKFLNELKTRQPADSGDRAPVKRKNPPKRKRIALRR